MRSLYKYIGIVMALLAVSSCSEKELEETSVGVDVIDQVEVGNLVEVPCEFLIQSFGASETKAKKDPEDYKENEYEINNFWLLQFGKVPPGGGEGDRPFLAAVYHAPNSESRWERINMSENHLPSTGLVWVVANIGQKDVNNKTFFSGYSGKKLSDFYADGFPLSETSQLKTLNGGAVTLADPDKGLAIPRSGSSLFDINDLSGIDDKKGLVVTLKSIVAKLTIDMKEVVGATTITMYGLPSKVSFVPEQVTQTKFNSLIYDYDIPIPASGKVTLYIPQNIPMETTKSKNQATEGIGLLTTKASNAPPKATYFSLGVNRSGKRLAINVFLGQNRYNYDVRANYHYKETVVATNDVYDKYLNDQKADSRLVQHVVETRQSNCYMLHPIFHGTNNNVISTNNRHETYVLPLVDRVNTAWTGNASKQISDSDEWLVHLLWQDEPKRLVFFSETSGLPAWQDYAYDGDDYAFEFYGKGNEGVYVTVARSIGNNFTRGNVLIALRKKTAGGSYTAANGQKYGDILWSWHLWVTDYRPDDAGSYSSGHYKNVPGVSGSRVFHFDFWGTTSSATYKWIMDRNLGARGWEPAGRYNTSVALNRQTAINPTAEGYGTFYQWGRKDPFPGRGVATGVNVSTLKLYNLDGTDITTRISSEATTSAMKMSDIHAKPTVLQQNINYSGMGGYWAWSTPNEKSLYDPCPVGWVVPSYTAYRGFVSELQMHNTGNMVIGYVARDDDSVSDEYYYGYKGYEGFAVDPLGSGVGACPIYFPASGFVNKNGNRDLGGLCDLWALDQKSTTISSYLYIGKSLGAAYDGTRGYSIAHIWGDTSEGANYFNKHYAFGMRCVKTTVSNQ